MNKSDLKQMRAIRRQQAIEAGNLSAYRMAGKTIPAKKGKGVAYKRNEKHRSAA